MDHELVIARNKEVIARIDVQSPFISAWNFADSDTAVVILYGNAHGPGRIGKFEITPRGGKLVAEVSSTEAYNAMPEWAKQFAERQ